jgi:hypothetical protein
MHTKEMVVPSHRVDSIAEGTRSETKAGGCSLAALWVPSTRGFSFVAGFEIEKRAPVSLVGERRVSMASVEAQAGNCGMLRC